MSERVNELLALVQPIIDRSAGVIGTHSASCYEYHVACLAVLVRDVLTPSNMRSEETR